MDLEAQQSPDDLSGGPNPPYTDKQLAKMTSSLFNIFPFERLRWYVFNDIADIQVLDDGDDASSALRPFAGHPIASELAIYPPRSRITVVFDLLDEREVNDEHDEEDRYVAPEPLQIVKNDGSPITIGDFVAQVHPYLNVHKDAIIEAEEDVYGNVSPDAPFVFQRCLGPGKDEEPEDERFRLQLYREGEDSKTIEQHWQEHAELLRGWRMHGTG